MARPGTFAKGNKAAVGSGGPGSRTKFLTEALISQLNELDPKTRKEKFHTLVAVLIRRAIKKEDAYAIKEIFDRVEGKPAQLIQGSGEGGAVHVTIEGGLRRDGE